MPNYVSVFGVWKPAHEKVYLPDEERIHDGEDREARRIIDENGGSMGQHYKTNLDLITIARQRGFKDVDEYLTFLGYDPKKAQEKFDEELKKVRKHELPSRNKAADVGRSGGDDESGQGKHIKGAFEAPPNVNVPRMK